MKSPDRQRFHLPTVIEKARANGGLLHDLQGQPGVTDELAKHGLYTTTETRNPGSFQEFSRVYGRGKSLGTIALRASDTLGSTPHYEEATREGRLGSAVADDLRGIKTMYGHDVHMATHPKAGKQQKGIVTAKSIELGVEDRDTAEKIAVALQGLMRTGQEGKFYPVVVGAENKDGLVTVHLPGHDEHAARSISRTVQALMDEELYNRYGVKLPEDKVPYDEWRRRNETFLPVVDRRLRAVRDEYHSGLVVDGSYREHPDMKPDSGKRMIGTDPAPMLEALRDIMNPLIDVAREGDYMKLEQHPDEVARPLNEEGIHLMRDIVKPGETRYGPPQSRPPSVREKGLQSVEEQTDLIKKSPGDALLSSVRSIVEGIPGPVSGTLKYGPRVVCYAADKGDMYKAWHRQKGAAEEDGEKLDNLARKLRRVEDGLPIWSEEE